MGPPHQLLHSQQVTLVAPPMLLATLSLMVMVAVHLEVVPQMVEDHQTKEVVARGRLEDEIYVLERGSAPVTSTDGCR
ncbi:hypothetical protein Tco_0560828 [Tanacetum coccineum]